MDRRVAVVSAVVSAACFGTLAILATLAYERGAEPLQLLTWRFGSAALLLAGYVALKRRASLKVSPRELASYAALAVVGYGAASICFFFALRFTDASVAAVLLYTYPGIVVVGERIVRGTRIAGRRLGAVALTFVGCVLVVDPFGDAGTVHPLGILLGLGAAVGYASFSMRSQRLLAGRPRVVIMTYLFAITALLAGSVALVSGAAWMPNGWSPDTWMLLAAIVLVPTFAAVVLYLRAIRSLGASQAAILSTVEPVFTLVLARVVLDEKLALLQALGAVLVLGGVLLAERAASASEQVAVV